MPCHHALAEALHAYINTAGIVEDRKGVLFRTSPGHIGTKLTAQPMSEMQRQQGEQLAQILQFLTAPSDSGEALHDVLKHLVASNTSLIVNMMDLGSSVREASRALPRQMAEAVTEALAAAEGRGNRG